MNHLQIHSLSFTNHGIALAVRDQHGGIACIHLTSGFMSLVSRTLTKRSSAAKVITEGVAKAQILDTESQKLLQASSSDVPPSNL